MATRAQHTDMNLDDLLDVATNAVDAASKLLATSNPGKHTAKGDRDYATELDYQIEQTVKDLLRAATPALGFLGEEIGPDTTTQPLSWVLDPIDGTINFAHGLPLCGISLALFDHDRPVIGVIDLPFLNARYTATEDGGAFCNRQRINVSSTASISDAIVTMGDYAVGSHAETKNKDRFQLTQLVASQALRVRMLGTAAVDLAWLAHGRTDVSISLSNKPWDVGAGVIIAREARVCRGRAFSWVGAGG